MDLPKIIAEYLLNLKILKKLFFFLLCILIFCLVILVYEGFVIKKEHERIKELQNKLTEYTPKINDLSNKAKRGRLSIVCSPKNKYSTSEDYFSMEKVLWNNVFNKTESTIDMNNWILESTDEWEKEINKNLNLLKNVISVEEYNLLQQTQQEWEEYKITELKFLNNFFNKPTGNMWYTIHILYKLKLIEDRAGTLYSLYENACDL